MDKIRNGFRELSSEIDAIRTMEMDEFDKEMYTPTLKASFTKCYDYCVSLEKFEKEDSFFIIPFLRGICEDIICLKFLSKNIPDLKERGTVVSNYMWYLQYTSIKAQQNFFSKTITDQVSIEVKEIDNYISEKENELKIFWASKGQNPNKIFPSVQHMAIDAKLINLYEFLYHATSKMVHFSPNVLMRLGWYEKEVENPEIIFNLINFNEYYYAFNNFYGPYLFVEFAKSFKKEFKLSKHFKDTIKYIEVELVKQEFYPELVTFEEMNLKRPNGFYDHLIRFAKKMEREKNNS